MIERHYSAKYDVELNSLSDQTLMMGRLVEKQLRFAVRAFINGDRILAKQVAETESLVNQMEVEIDAKCTELLALRQPIASDLRFVLMVIKTVNDLERMGDEVTRVASLGSQASDSVNSSDQSSSFAEIKAFGKYITNLLHETLVAFEQTDDARSLELLKKNKKVEKKFHTTLNSIRNWMVDEPDVVPVAVDILWAIRSLERVGDRSINICEHVIFYVKGDDIRHLNIDQIMD